MVNKITMTKLPSQPLTENEAEETAYERLLCKVNEKRSKGQSAKGVNILPSDKTDWGIVQAVEEVNTSMETITSNLEEDMIMEVGAADVRSTFPSEEDEIMSEHELSCNNNATVGIECQQVQMSAGSRTLPRATKDA